MFRGTPFDKVSKAQKTLNSSNFKPLKADVKFEDWDMDLRNDEPEAQEIKPTTLIDPKDQTKLNKEFLPASKREYSLPSFGGPSETKSRSEAGDVICGEELFISICETAIQVWIDEHAEELTEKLLQNFTLNPKKKQKK